MLDRRIQPEVNTLEDISFVHPQHFDIKNGIQLHWINTVADDAVKIDLVFDAGSRAEQPALASFANSLLMAGTPKYSADELHARLDGLGGFFHAETSREGATVTLYGLRKNIYALFTLLIEAISEANFPQKEVDQLINQKQQSFKVSSEKVSFIARRLFTQNVFANSPYGTVTQYEDYAKITQEAIQAFHKKHYLQGLQKVCVVGDLDPITIDEMISLVKPMVGELATNFLTEVENTKGEFRQEKEGAVQTAIRIGRILFNRTAEDYLKFSVMNTIFGGYFGSRLMSNIREDKGYTYGIGSGLAEMRKLGYFFISTEVGKDVADKALEEIKHEIERLQTELVSEEELSLVRNYTIGQMLKASDGPFAMMDRYLGVADFGLDYDYYTQKIELVKSITPEEIREMAKKYLKWEDMTVVLAG
ncbi:Predicted Zn-dependent peptidase [Lishizhenia tianjinensis]|uniref:Predicted Zn-dependent peptidase n=1 Tax=Lishizhenia tianjinensis TaxID=477690 RepID=A0A1I7BUJ0_9FLAO|nr:pitrilysin family protein [Lishizhenia tianjinensis]SFT90810.1 Predicted Zn-dependent peptidase [Lishizhenia tianjinensis]